MTMQHDLVSELLADFVHGRLTPEVEGEVRAHLDSCRDCRLELGAVRTLGDVPGAALEASERVALRDAVRGTIAPKPSRWRRLAPALGAAGLVAVLAVGAAVVLTREDTGFRTADSGAEGAGPERDAGVEGAGPERDDAVTQEAGAAAGGGGVAQDTEENNQRAAKAAGTVASLAATTQSLADIGPLGPQLLGAEADLFDAGGDRAGTRRLRGLLPTRGWVDQAIDCTRRARELLPSDASLAYAAAFPSERVLVLGFVWDHDGTRRFAFWGWPQGDCSTVTPIHARGVI